MLYILHLYHILTSLLHTIIFTTYHHPTQSSIPILNTDIHLHTQPTQMLHGMVECPRTPPSLLNRPSPATFNPCQPQKLSYTCLTYHESTSKDDIRWHIEQVKWHIYHELIEKVNDSHIDPPLYIPTRHTDSPTEAHSPTSEWQTQQRPLQSHVIRRKHPGYST